MASSSSKSTYTCLSNHTARLCSMMILLCKMVGLSGILIGILSDHWAKDPRDTRLHADYRHRCAVHLCAFEDPDPTWIVDLMCILVIVNLSMELIFLVLMKCTSCAQVHITTIFQGTMFLLSFIIIDCQIFFGIHIVSYVYSLPMGYAYKCFASSSIFSAIEWALSLKRFTTEWDQVIVIPDSHWAMHNNATTVILAPERFATITEENEDV